MIGTLHGTVEAGLTARLAPPVQDAVDAVVAALLDKGRGCVAAVLFYGSILRTGELDGLLDLYVLVDDLTGWHGPGWRAPANRLLPPNVEYWEAPSSTSTVRAKVAVMTVGQFARHVHADALDTTIWARFAQPARLVYARDPAARAAAVDAVAMAVATAMGWAVRLGPDTGTARDYWNDLFRRTYATELRVETGARAGTLVDFAPDHYDALTPPALAAAGLAVTDSDGRLRPQLQSAERAAARRRWALRQLLGKPLNVARLAKALFTFRGGVDYILWKIERHSGVRLDLTRWQRRWPLLAAPGLLWRLYRQGAIR